MIDQFKIGNMTMLKSSNNVTMTVKNVIGDKVECCWFDNEGKLNQEFFHHTMLRPQLYKN